ncbi:hypothetical protein AAFN85_03350 [Mucilaginibacter sp. CAU 1740]
MSVTFLLNIIAADKQKVSIWSVFRNAVIAAGICLADDARLSSSAKNYHFFNSSAIISAELKMPVSWRMPSLNSGLQ